MADFTVFQDLSNIFTKKVIPEDMSSYLPFMINRYLSFASPALALAVNEATNKISYEDKRLHMITACGITPKTSKAPYIRYVAKTTKEKKEVEDKRITIFASNMELSKREVKLMLKECDHK